MNDRTEGGEGWRAVAGEMIGGTRDAIGRFPVTSLFLLLAAIDASVLVAQGGFFSSSRHDYVLELGGGAMGSLAAALFLEARGSNPLLKHGASLLAGLICIALLWFDDEARTLDWTLLAALLGLLPTAPFMGRGTPGAFWLFSVRLAFALLLGFLAMLLFAGGISAILASLTYLFGLAVPERLYAHIWVLTALLLAPLFAIGQIPRDFSAEPDADGRGVAARGIRALGEFAAAPLLIVYALILHAYALKILLTGSVPKGQIGWLVLAFGLCIIGSLIICRPFMRASRAPTRFFLRVWPFMLPVPLVLLGYALGLRVGEYGFTPQRYLLACFGLVLLANTVLQFLKRTKGDIRFMAALPAIVLFLASFGPQGAISRSIDSQAGRFLSIVEAPPVTGERQKQALDSLRYLAGKRALARVTPEGYGGHERYTEVASAWGLDASERRSDGGTDTFNLTYPSDAAFAVPGFDTLMPNTFLAISHKKPSTVQLANGPTLKLSLKRDSLEIRKGEETVRFPLDARRIIALSDDPKRPAEPQILVSGSRRVAIAPSGVTGKRGANAGVESFSGAIMLRSEDWR